MAESFVEVSTGSGTKLHSWARTVGANTVHDSFYLPGEYPIASYRIIASAISVATASDHILAIQAGSSLNVRLRRIWLRQLANATTATLDSFIVLRLTTAGTGGTAVTPAKLDNSDSAAGCTAMTLPSSKGTESTEIDRDVQVLRQAFLTTATQPQDKLEWIFGGPNGNMKPLLIAAGTSNGVAVKNGSAVAGATVIIGADIVETSFV